MKNNKKIIGIIALVVVILSIIIMIGIKFSTKSNGENTTPDETVTVEDSTIDITGYENIGDTVIQSASKILADNGIVNGYTVTVAANGYNGKILMDVSFDKTGDTITSLSINEQNESADFSAKLLGDEFLSQFVGIAAPVSLKGMKEEDTDTSTEDTVEDETTEDSSGSTWIDGTYISETKEYDDKGFINTVSITIKDSRIVEVIWDAFNDAGELKSVLSADGLYVMTKDGLTWQEQATALAEYVIKNQSADGIVMDGNGNTDSVTGVSISVNGFIDLLKDCLIQASSSTGAANENTVEEASIDETITSDETTTSDETATDEITSVEGTPIDGVSGATISSTAIVNGINAAQTFIKEFAIAK